MGFFDFCCPVSGLSLRAANAVHVGLIALTPGRWQPLTLPLAGCYDRLGSIDGFKPDFRTEMLVAGFARFARAGRVAADDVAGEFAEFTGAPDILGLLAMFERVNTMSQWNSMKFTLDGHPLRQVLVHAEVFAALAPVTRRPQAPTSEQLAAQLARSPMAPQARELYEQAFSASDAVRSAAGVALTQLTSVTDWLERRGLGWSPVVESGQFYPDDDLKFARQARVRLADAPELLPVIDRSIAEFEREVADA